jgi:hypothetical protein
MRPVPTRFTAVVCSNTRSINLVIAVCIVAARRVSVHTRANVEAYHTCPQACHRVRLWYITSSYPCLESLSHLHVNPHAERAV